MKIIIYIYIMSFTINYVTYTPSTGTNVNITGYNFPPNPWNLVIPSTVANSSTTYNVTTIKDYAFLNCGSLTSVTIPSSVTTINDAAFLNCGSLTSVTFKQLSSTIVLFGNNIFENDTLFTNVYLTYSNVSIESFFAVKYPTVTVSIISTDPPCFKEGSKILTDKGYKTVQDLRNGDLVKTYLHGYLPIVLIGKSQIYNSGDLERIKNRLWRCFEICLQ